MHQMKLRRLTVKEVVLLTPSFRRVIFTGPDLADFVTLGPTDHMKVFFPDESGQIVTPTFGPDGIRPPESGTVIARDYTPAHFDPESLELAIDFYLHESTGPASAWASNASIGDELVIAGPRGSHLPPTEIGNALLIADETSLPSTACWLNSFPADLPVTALISIEDSSSADYLKEHAVRWFTGDNREAELEAAVRQLNELGPESFVFLAGEAGLIARLRRYLRQELGLTKEQVDAHGYWKRGTANHDHHAPLEPTEFPTNP